MAGKSIEDQDSMWRSGFKAGCATTEESLRFLDWLHKQEIVLCRLIPEVERSPHHRGFYPISESFDQLLHRWGTQLGEE